MPSRQRLRTDRRRWRRGAWTSHALSDSINMASRSGDSGIVTIAVAGSASSGSLVSSRSSWDQPAVGLRHQGPHKKRVAVGRLQPPRRALAVGHDRSVAPHRSLALPDVAQTDSLARPLRARRGRVTLLAWITRSWCAIPGRRCRAATSKRSKRRSPRTLDGAPLRTASGTARTARKSSA